MSSRQFFVCFLIVYLNVGTSDGTQSHLNDLRGGHCNDTENGIFMKIEVYVCKKSNLTHKGNVQLLQCNNINRSVEVHTLYTDCVRTCQVNYM